MNNKIIYYGSILIVGLMLSTYWFSKYFNSWEKKMGLTQVSLNDEKEKQAREIYQFEFLTGKTQIEFYDNHQYKIYLYKDQSKYLYSKGEWSFVERGEEFIGDDGSLLLKSIPLFKKYAKFRFYNYKLRGKMINLEGEELMLSSDFAKLDKVIEIFKFAVTGGLYLIDRNNEVTYNLHEIIEPGLDFN